MDIRKEIKLLVLDVDGTMTDGGIYITEKGEQFKKFHARDGLGIRMAIKQGIEVGIISHSLSTAMVDTRARMLGMNYYYIGQRPKLEVLDEWLAELKLSYQEVAFIGDDLNDLDIIEKAGFTACPADGAAKVKSKVDVVLSLKGGEGCVREFVDTYLLP
ncbi:MAG: HAD-IIIA family hydrolase [Cyclobacteriaceae bacterium]|nr:HAD-IIIA family hydrolase [Cyclobacteriaceae bacterium]